MSFIECSDHMKDQWSKPKPKPRFKCTEVQNTEILELELFIYKVRKTAFNNSVINSIINALELWFSTITSLIK